MKQLTIFILLILFTSSFVIAQSDSLSIQKNIKEKSFLKKSILPLSLTGMGLIVKYSNGNLSKENLQDKIQNKFDDFHTNLDDITFFLPAALMYSADLMKIESKNDVFTQTKYLVIAGIANNLINYGVKVVTDDDRPNGERYSFPSLHTSNAFVMARVLHHEFMETSPVIVYCGYFFAATTGTLRVLNNEHWVSDVLAGAGLGIIITDLVYRFEPFRNWNPFQNKNVRFILSPSIDKNQYGLYANLRF